MVHQQRGTTGYSDPTVVATAVCASPLAPESPASTSPHDYTSASLTLLQGTTRRSVLNVQMLLEVPFKKMDGSLNKPEIVELLWLDNFKVLNQLMLSSSMILQPLFSPKQLVQLFSSPTLILPYAEPSQHARSKLMDVELITLVATWSSMPLPVPSPPSRTLMPVMKTLSASPAPTLVVLPSLRIPGR